MKTKTQGLPQVADVPHAQATYHEPRCSLYQGNPLIEALPVPIDDAALAEKLSFYPAYTRKLDTQAPAVERHEMIGGLKYFFQSLPRHAHLAQGISSMIRSGYVPRCPLSVGGQQLSVPRSLESAALMGSSGTGKSQSIERILRLYEQVIVHSNYKGKQISETQVVWLKVECPHDGSPRALCTTFLEKLDVVLGTNYSDAYGGQRSTINTMIPAVVKLARIHHLGLLVIDEIQNLLVRKTGAGEELLNFIVRIINDIGIPVLMVGTANTDQFLSQAFRVTRRATNFLQPDWGRLVENHPEWEIFITELWRYRYVQKDSPLTDAMKHLVYDLTQGIPDLAVKLYSLSQQYAINNEIEQVTPEVLKAVASQAFVRNRKYLQDLRNGITPRGDIVYEEAFSQPKLPLFPDDPVKPGKKTRKKTEPALDAPSLVLFGGAAVPDGESTYEAMKRAGNVHRPDSQEPTTVTAVK